MLLDILTTSQEAAFSRSIHGFYLRYNRMMQAKSEADPANLETHVKITDHRYIGVHPFAAADRHSLARTGRNSRTYGDLGNLGFDDVEFNFT